MISADLRPGSFYAGPNVHPMNNGSLGVVSEEATGYINSMTPVEKEVRPAMPCLGTCYEPEGGIDDGDQVGDECPKRMSNSLQSCEPWCRPNKLTKDGIGPTCVDSSGPDDESVSPVGAVKSGDSAAPAAAPSRATEKKFDLHRQPQYLDLGGLGGATGLPPLCCDSGGGCNGERPPRTEHALGVKRPKGRQAQKERKVKRPKPKAEPLNSSPKCKAACPVGKCEVPIKTRDHRPEQPTASFCSLAAIAQPPSKKDIPVTPAARAVAAKEWKRLLDKGVWGVRRALGWSCVARFRP